MFLARQRHGVLGGVGTPEESRLDQGPRHKSLSDRRTPVGACEGKMPSPKGPRFRGRRVADAQGTDTARASELRGVRWGEGLWGEGVSPSHAPQGAVVLVYQTRA